MTIPPDNLAILESVQKARKISEPHGKSGKRFFIVVGVLFTVLLHVSKFHLRDIACVCGTMNEDDVNNTKINIHVGYSQYSDFSTTSIAKANKTVQKLHWCVISDLTTPLPPPKGKGPSGWFNHFPHACEILLPCWSWFVSQNAQDACGFLLLDGLDIQNGTWHHQLISKGMKCIIRKERLTTEMIGSSIQHSPNMKWLHPRFGHRNYLARPEDAQELRRRIVPMSDKEILRLRGKDSPPQIGLLNRPSLPEKAIGNRVITNMNNISSALKLALPDAIVDGSFPGDSTIEDQAIWFATKDVIIACHGAALTNAIFVSMGTIVIQAYPPKFHWTSMDPLIEQAGVLALDWYEGRNPLETHFETQKDWKEKNKAQFRDFNIPEQDIVDLVLVCLGRQKPSNITKWVWR